MTTQQEKNKTKLNAEQLDSLETYIRKLAENEKPDFPGLRDKFATMMRPGDVKISTSRARKEFWAHCKKLRLELYDEYGPGNRHRHGEQSEDGSERSQSVESGRTGKSGRSKASSKSKKTTLTVAVVNNRLNQFKEWAMKSFVRVPQSKDKK